MAGRRRVVVAALLQLAFSRALPADTYCYGRGELSQGSGYFYCSEPRLNFNDTQNELTMDFRNRNNGTVSSLSLKRAGDAFHLITRKDNKEINRTKLDLPDSSNELQLNINRSSVHAKTRGSWRKLDIPETKDISSLYFRSSNPSFCITCHGGHIWDNDKAIEPDTQSTEQSDVQTTQNTEQDAEHEPGTWWPLWFILLPILALLLYKRKCLCGKLLCQDLRTCCRKIKGTTPENEQEMPGCFHQAREGRNGLMYNKGDFEAGRGESGGVETENDMYISADEAQRCRDDEYETVNDIYVSADVHHPGSNEYETLNEIYMSADDC